MEIPTPPDVTLWHNPGCSKSRRAKELLEQAQCKVTVRHYLDDPPTIDELRSALDLLGISLPGIRAAQLVRRDESIFAELGLQTADDAQLLEAMSRHPILIQRPIAFTARRAALGRPMGEMVLAVLEPTTPEGMSPADAMRAAAQGKLGR